MTIYFQLYQIWKILFWCFYMYTQQIDTIMYIYIYIHTYIDFFLNSPLTYLTFELNPFLHAIYVASASGQFQQAPDRVLCFDCRQFRSIAEMCPQHLNMIVYIYIYNIYIWVSVGWPPPSHFSSQSIFVKHYRCSFLSSWLFALSLFLC